MSRHQRPRRSGRPRRKQGFSRPVSKQWFQMLGIPQDQKRAYFNMLSKCVVGTFAVTGFAVGVTQLGFLAGVIGGFGGAVFGVWFVTQDRMFR